MNKVGWFLFPLSLSLFLASFLIAPSPQPGSHTIEKIEGSLRTVDRIDDQGYRHGRQEAYFNGVLVYEAEVEHGQVLWRKEYDADGKLKEHQKEGDDYNLIPQAVSSAPH